MQAKIFAQVGIIVFVYYVLYYVYKGILDPVPGLGDSWDYHIPISEMILRGEFISPKNVLRPIWYYPGSSEAINSILIFFHVPLTLSNLLAVIVLFFCCWKLGGIANLGYYESIFFATTIVTLNALVRWYNAVSIDVWVAIFFILSIILFERPKKTSGYFLTLGFTLSMLIGSKYSTWWLVGILLLFYARIFIHFGSMKRLLIFTLPFTTFGLFWYIRNIILVNNPFYPLPFFGLPYALVFSDNVLGVTLAKPKEMFDAFFGEYKIWILAPLITILKVLQDGIKKKLFPMNVPRRISLIGIFLFIVFLSFPTSDIPSIMVSSFRYSYPAMILLILSLFLLAKKYRFLNHLSLISLSSMISVVSFSYHPKLTIGVTLIGISSMYLLEKYNVPLKKVFS